MQAEPMLAHTLETLPGSMRTLAQLSLSVQERISITRGIALFSLAFDTMRRGEDLSFTLGSKILRLLDPNDSFSACSLENAAFVSRVGRSFG